MKKEKESEEESGFEKESGFRTLELINSWINNADTKISFLLAFDTALLGLVFYSGGIPPQAFVSFNAARAENLLTFKNYISVGVLIIMYSAFVGSIIIFITALYGKIKVQSKKGSLFFFGTIAKMSQDNYMSRMLNISTDEFEKDLLGQIYTNSCICNRKFQLYNLGLIFLLIATLLYIVALWCGIL